MLLENAPVETMRRLAAATLIVVLAALQLAGLASSPAPDRSSAAPAAAWINARLAPRTGEGQLGVYSGRSFTHASDLVLSRRDGSSLMVPGAEWEPRDFDDPFYYGARISRWFAGSLGGMVDFTHAKVFARMDQQVETQGTLGAALPPPGRTTMGELFKRLELSHGHNWLTLNGLWRLPFATARLKPYVGLGLGIGLPHAEVHVAGDVSRTYEYQVTGPAVQGLAGIEFRTRRGLSFFLEYKLALTAATVPLTGNDTTRSGLGGDLWRQMSRWLAGERARDGELAANLLTHQVVGGIALRFEPLAAAP